jgi:hypothetical protein
MLIWDLKQWEVLHYWQMALIELKGS